MFFLTIVSEVEIRPTEKNCPWLPSLRDPRAQFPHSIAFPFRSPDALRPEALLKALKRYSMMMEEGIVSASEDSRRRHGDPLIQAFSAHFFLFVLPTTAIPRFSLFLFFFFYSSL